MKVSFAVTVHNEDEYVRTLLTQLCTFIDTYGTQDEVVVVEDLPVDPDTTAILQAFDKPYIHRFQHALDRDFATHKNYLTRQCTGDYIFQIDADERVAPELLTNLHAILEMNATVDLFLVPRINTVHGLTPQHIAAWGWTVNDRGWIQWPDYQTRLYRNAPDRIQWVGRVHERIVGFDQHAHLPAAESFCLIHDKTIDRQERQNAFYAGIHS